MDGGTLPQWLSFGVTSAAVIIALLVYRKSVWDGRTEQPRKVRAVERRQQIYAPDEEVPWNGTTITDPGGLLTASRSNFGTKIYRTNAKCFAVTIRVTNDSAEVITFVSVRVGWSLELSDCGGESVPLRHLAPGDSQNFMLILPPPSEPFESKVLLMPAVAFRDGLGRRWVGLLGSPLRRELRSPHREKAWWRYMRRTSLLRLGRETQARQQRS